MLKPSWKKLSLSELRASRIHGKGPAEDQLLPATVSQEQRGGTTQSGGLCHNPRSSCDSEP